MDLTQQDKEVLTLLDDLPADIAVSFVTRFFNLPEAVIDDMIQLFLKEGLIQKSSLPQGETERDWYFHTGLVTAEMLDEDMRYKRDMGAYPKEEISYPIEEEHKEGHVAVLKVGKRWREGKYLKYEGFTLKVPQEVRDLTQTTFPRATVFAVMSIKHGQEHETYELWLHGHSSKFMVSEQDKQPADSNAYIDAGGDIEVTLTLGKEVLKSWTRLSGRDIDAALERVHMGYTYNLMLALPRTVTVTDKKVLVQRNFGERVDGMNVCQLLLKNNHPIDKNRSDTDA